MRNDSANWTPAAPLARAPVEIAETRLEVIVPERQTLLSGSIGALLEMSGVETATGWPKPATGESYALCLRRDRILRVNGTALEDGWYEAVGVAVSDMTDGYAVIQVSGPSALSVLKRGTEIDPSEPSAATARLRNSPRPRMSE